MPDRYRAIARIAPAEEIRDEGGPGLASTLGGLAGVGGLFGSETRFVVQLEALRSYDVAERLVSEPAFMADLFPGSYDAESSGWRDGVDPPEIWDVQRALSERASVTLDARAGSAEASYLSPDPQRAAELLGLWIATADSLLRNRELEEVREAVALLEAEMRASPYVEVQQALEQHIASELRRGALVKAGRAFAFDMLQHPVPPDRPAYPKPLLVAAVVALLYLTFRFLLVVLLGRDAVRGREA